jgi:hypothetical protein
VTTTTAASTTTTTTTPPSGSTTLERRVDAKSDDAEENGDGEVDLGSSDLELVEDEGAQTVGMRFRNVTVPPGATILNAYVQFKVDEKSTPSTSLQIRGESSGNALTFAGADGNVSSRPTTTTFVAWNPGPWNSVGAAGGDQQTPDLKDIIDEIVNGGGWSNGNALVLIITGTGMRVAEAYDGLPSGAPLLHIEYAAGSSTTTTPSTSSTTTTVPGPSTCFTATYQHGASGPANSSNVDTYIRRSSASSNFGGKSDLFVGVTDGSTKVFRSFLAFNLATVSPGATVTSCKLTVRVTDTEGPTPGHIRSLCGQHWLDGNGQSENQATWNRWKSGSNWGTAGASSTAACNAGGDYSDAGEVGYTPPSGTGLFTFPDISALCQDAIDNGTWLRLRLTQDSESSKNKFFKFDSSDASSASRRPKLVVTWCQP